MLSLRIRVTMTVMLLLCFSLQAQETTFLSLEAAVDKALEQNSTLRANKFAYKKAGWDKINAWTQLLPRVSLNTRYTWIDDSTYALRDFGRFFLDEQGNRLFPQTAFQESYYTSFDVSMPLFNGAILNGLAFAGAAKDLAKSQLTYTEKAIVYQVISTYLSAVHAQEVFKLQKEYLQLSGLNYQKAERLQQAGRYSKLEALRWKVEFQQQKSIVSQSGSGLRSALSALARVTSTPMQEKLQVEDKLPDNLIQESIRLRNMDDASLLKLIELNEDELLKANAALAAAKSSEKMSKHMYRGTYANYLPNINLNYSYAWQENNTIDLDLYSPKTLMVNFSWPLFSSFQDFSTTKANQYEYKRSQEQYKDQMQNLHFTLTQTANKLIDLKTQIELSETNVEYTQNNYNIVAKQKEKGLVSNIDFIDAKLNWQNAKLSRLKNRYDFISSMVELYYMLGKLNKLL